MPGVSIIMNCYNGERYLREAVESIINQTYKDWELVFYDNASTDSSADIIGSYCDPRINYYRRSSTVPLGQARNHALSMASGSYIAFLDVDDYWLPGKLESQMALLADHPGLDMVYGDAMCLYVQEAHQRPLFNMLLGSQRPPRGNIFQFLLHKYVINMGTVLIKRDSLNTLEEWFDETMSYSPDFDLFMRLAVHSETDYVDEILMVYRVHQKSLSHSVEQARKYLEPYTTLDKIRNADPGLADTLRRDFQACIIKTVATQLWKQGQAGQARKMAREAIATREGLVLYLMSWLPFKLVEKLADRILWFRRKKSTEPGWLRGNEAG